MSPTARRVGIVVLVALVGALQWLHRHRPPAPVTSSAPRATRAPLHRGTLNLAECEIGGLGAASPGTLSAFCAPFDVPEDWERPEGRHIRLKVALVRSQAAHGNPDLVTFLTGGPGEAATEDYPVIAGALAPVRRRHEILLVDQRGTGGSNALSCKTSAAAANTAALPRLTEPGDLASTLPRLRQCLADVRTYAAPEFYTTTNAVRDLEAVRQALGSPQLDLIGISYGTRVAQQYARRYPTAVRSIVLDSAVPNSLALGAEHARNLEQALQGLFARCRSQSVCEQHFGDPYATLYRVRDRLRSQPQQVSMRDPLTFEQRPMQFTDHDLAVIVRFYAYSPVTAAVLPLMLQQADQNNYAPLLGQKQWLSDDLSSAISSGLELSVMCAEDADLLAPNARDDATLLGNALVSSIVSACTVWPRGARPEDFHQPFRTTLPLLVLSGEYDPVTPPAYGAQIVQGQPLARLLLAHGQGHGVIGEGCMPKLVGDFVDAADPRALDAQCLKALGDTPAFIDFNGAAP